MTIGRRRAEPGDVLGLVDGDVVVHRRDRRRRSPRRCSTGCSPAAASWSRWSPGADAGDGLADAVAGARCGARTPRSRS